MGAHRSGEPGLTLDGVGAALPTRPALREDGCACCAWTLARRNADTTLPRGNPAESVTVCLATEQ